MGKLSEISELIIWPFALTKEEIAAQSLLSLRVWKYISEQFSKVAQLKAENEILWKALDESCYEEAKRLVSALEAGDK